MAAPRLLSHVLRAWGLRFRVECGAAARWDTIDITLDARSGILYNKGGRAWRLRGALLELERQGAATPRVVQIVNGHIVFALLVARHLLSVPQRLLQFA